MNTLTFAEKLAQSICIFCGAPLTGSDRCNYCGSYYHLKNNFKLSLDGHLEFDALEFETISDYNNDFIMVGQFKIRNTMMHIPRLTIKLSTKYSEIIKTWLDQQSFYNFRQNTGYPAQSHKKDVLINFDKYRILSKGVIICSFQEKLDKGFIKIDLIPDVIELYN